MWRLPECFPTLRRSLDRASIAILAASLLVTAHSSASDPAGFEVQVQNLAGVSRDAIAEMRSVGQAIFAKEAIRSHWQHMGEAVNESASTVSTASGGMFEPRTFFLRLTTSRHAFSESPNCLGEALVAEGNGSLAIVYVDRIRTFAQNNRLPFGTVLGHAAAHEVGHLLLGTSEHTRQGLMRGLWTDFEIEAIRIGALRIGSPMARRISDSMRKHEKLRASVTVPPKP